MSDLLSIRRLSVDYRTPRGRLHALREVSFSVPRSRIVGLVGESGCGKSTLISSIIRLNPPQAEVVDGVIEFESHNLLGLPDSQMRRLRGDRITIVFQDPMTALNPVLSIGAQMADAQFRSRRSRLEKRQRSVDMLTSVGIADAEDRLSDYPHQFSGGMLQRVSIAMALQAEPSLLITDEPTTALDTTSQSQIIRLLRELQSRMGCSILFVSHDLGLIAEICDRVAVMYAGEVVEEGSVKDVFHDPHHPYTRKLIECDPARIEHKTAPLPSIPGEVPHLREVPQGCIFKDRCPEVFEECQTVRPALPDPTNDHRAACHLTIDGEGEEE